MLKISQGVIGVVICTSVFCFADGLYKKEIELLMGVVQNTKCAFERNGDRYSGVDAIKHIQKKYDYYSDDISSAEDFIRLAASKSTFSGKEYYIVCDSAHTKSSQWLLDTLHAFRKSLKQ